jgi:hypothetical protein
VSTVADERLAHVVPDRRSAEFYRVAFGDKSGIAVLHGLDGRRAEPILERAVRVLDEGAQQLANAQSYTKRFAATEYESPYAALDALRALLRTAQLFPDAVWTVEGGAP